MSADPITGLAGAAIGPGAGRGYRNSPIQKIIATTAPALTSYQAAPNDATILVDATAAAFSLYLPPAAQAAGRIYTVKKVDSGANAVTLSDVSGATIEGAATLALAAQYGTAIVQSDGTSWWRVGKI
ncbi:hypothetical protein [Paraburkholderia caballeronis]|uniref:hypothetical protein n=1 Tax=Paraburkholderia caballeronis TaxID=416943 RepID=UPI0010663334|nr:hypothetical protein [Paraburkholderia caballeronis]TDV06061.1 hypothetical protein C7408_12442 [Paraburkholderia caballeronis]TDV09601.1 hypothetical protein C7406_12642 [Paraburkholderia caballeronis]TDV21666.1 hypothetical protein C7404_12142 [Paraburkholderia caballeronis]